MRPRMLALPLGLLLGLSLPVPGPAHAQFPRADPSDRWDAGVAASFETFVFADPAVADVERLSLLTTSFGARVPLFGPASIAVAGRYARGELVRQDRTVTLNGLTDTELVLSLPVRRGGFVTTLNGLALLPTGTVSLSDDEAALAGMVASELLPFRITHWGTGGAVGASIGAAYGGPGGSLGLSAGYLVGRSFEPFEPLQGTTFSYQPGNQLQLRAALDRNVGGAGKVSLALALLHSGADTGEGRTLYQSGDRYQAMGSYSFAVGQSSSAILYLGGVHRTSGEVLEESLPGMPAQDLVLAGGGMRVPAAGGVLLPSVDGRLFRRASGEDQGYLAGLGIAWEWPVAGVRVAPGVRGRFGRLIVADELETGLTGLEFDLSIRSARRAGR